MSYQKATKKGVLESIESTILYEAQDYLKFNMGWGGEELTQMTYQDRVERLENLSKIRDIVKSVEIEEE